MATLGELLNVLVEADNVSASFRSQLSEADRVMKEAEEALLNAMKEQGVDKVRNDELTVTLQKKQRPHVTDWDAFYKVVSKNPQLLERRVSAKPFAELLEARKGRPVPGVQIYEYEALRKTRE